MSSSSQAGHSKLIKYFWFTVIAAFPIGSVVYLVNNAYQRSIRTDAFQAEEKRLESLNIPKDKNGSRYLIGNISGRHIQIPPGVVGGWITYNGDPSDFDYDAKEKYQRPPISYDSKIALFDFRFRLTDGALWRLGTQTELDYKKDSYSQPVPWVNTLVYSGDNYPRPSKKMLLDSYLKDYSHPISQVPMTYAGTELGLEVYRYFGGTKPPPDNSWEKGEVYLRRNSEGDITMFIMCANNPRFAVNFCRQFFFMPDDDIEVFFNARYPRQFLPQWQHIETQAIQIVHGFVVPPASPSPQP